MRRALQLAALGEGRTSPNPLVGAVVLDAAGQLVGEGFHERAGLPHAEVGALAQAGERARGGTLVVTLEPCCHHGRTPPCSDAVIAAGIARVVVGVQDPNPQVAGGGIQQLKEAGIEVIVGVCAARTDDPLLTSRGQREPEPLRVVISRSLRLPEHAQLWDTTTAPTLVAHGYDAPVRPRFRLDAHGIERVLLQPSSPATLLEELTRHGCNRVLWECGPELAAAAIREGCVQEVAAVVAPKLMGGAPAHTPLGELGFTAMDQVPSWESAAPQALGNDWLFALRPAPDGGGRP